MRNYREKMALYRVSKDRKQHIILCCKRKEISEISIETVLKASDLVWLKKWLTPVYTGSTESIAKKVSSGMPCNEDSFRIHRERFFMFMELLVFGNHKN